MLYFFIWKVPQIFNFFDYLESNRLFETRHFSKLPQKNSLTTSNIKTKRKIKHRKTSNSLKIKSHQNHISNPKSICNKKQEELSATSKTFYFIYFFDPKSRFLILLPHQDKRDTSSNLRHLNNIVKCSTLKLYVWKNVINCFLFN